MAEIIISSGPMPNRRAKRIIMWLLGVIPVTVASTALVPKIKTGV